MANQENHLSTPTLTERVEQIIEGDTYPISDNESTPDSGNLIDTNVDKLQGDFNDSMSQDSLTNEETNSKVKVERPSSATTNSKFSSKMSTMKSTSNGTAALRSLALDEHIKLVKQKKEEAEVLRLQKFQEQLRKKEQKWQQQQLERVKKWLQLRNRDIDHRTQVEERRKRREEEAKAKIEELIRREKEREQRVQHNRATKPDNVMTMSTDIAPSRRAISASRLRPTHHDRRYGNESSDENCNIRDEIERRPIHNDRQNINETIRRLAKPKNSTMTQSIHAGATKTAKTLPISRSSHQLRMTASSIATTTTTNRRQPSSRPATVPTSIIHSRTSPSDESTNQNSKVPSVSKKPPTRSKPVMTRSLMTTSHSSSSLSSSVKRRPTPTSPSKSKTPNETESIRQTKTDDEREQTPPILEEPKSQPILEEPKSQPILDEQEYQRKLNQKIREAQQRLEAERQREEERQRQLELEEYEREQEQIRLVEEQRRAEQERLQRAIEECERENELKRQEELRLQQQREEFERKQAEETERLNRERQEKARKEEEERIERKKRLDLIMRRTRQTSPTSKQDALNSTPTESNGHINNDNNTIVTSPKSSMPHSISDNHFPTSTSTDNFLLTNSVATPSLSSTTDLPKFKSPLIQSLLNKARSTRSTDNLIQTSMTSSQIMTESIIDETLTMTKSTDLSQENGHSLTRPIEAATAAFQ